MIEPRIRRAPQRQPLTALLLSDARVAKAFRLLLIYALALRVVLLPLPAAAAAATAPAQSNTPATVRVNSGGGQYVDSQGRAWQADSHSQSGSVYAPASLSSTDILNTADDPLYRSERYGGASGQQPLTYSVPVPSGSYLVRLHFAEIWHGVGAPGGAGSRVFDVRVEGAVALDDYDVYARSGGALRAVVEEWRAAVTDGALTLELTASADNAKLSAFEVISETTGGGPAAPSGLAATPGFGQINLDWNDSAGATGYNVYRDLTSSVSTSGTPLNGTTPLDSSSFVDTSVAVNTTYFYVVTAVNGAGSSPPSTAASAKASSPVVCGVSVNPSIINFSGMVADTYAGSGFNCFLPGTLGPDAAGTGLALSGFNSHLVVASADGDVSGPGAGAQRNALALKFANGGSYSVRARVKGPFAPSAQGQSAGIFLALDGDNYASLRLRHAGGGGSLEFGVETGASFAPVSTASFDLAGVDSNAEAIELWLVRKADGRVEALYRAITSFNTSPVFGPIVSAGLTPSAPSWSLSAGELYGGLLTTDSGPGGSFNTTFDEFELGPEVVPGNAPSPISFTTKTILKGGGGSGAAFGVAGFVNPTSLELGPDGKLYVATQEGRLYVLTLDQSKLRQPGEVAVKGVQVLDDIFAKPTRTCNVGGDPNNCQYLSGTPVGRQVTGLAVGPESTPTRVVLYVGHSDPRVSQNSDGAALAIDTHSGTITRLTLQPNAATPDPHDYGVTGNADIVAGLPRSRENHSVNGMSFGPDGWLYYSIGGNTNYGQRSTFFSDLPEYYLSASVLRLNVGGLGGSVLPLDMSGVDSASDMSAFAGKSELFATGFRNGYDLAWHSNGKLYLNNNGGNGGLGNTPGASDGCAAPSINPGTLADMLHHVTANSHGGHPNPAQGRCVLNDGTSYNPNLAPDAGYKAPLWLYNNSASSDGIVEYRSDAFGGQMRGNLITATYAGNQNVRRLVLSADGTRVTQEINLGQFGQPLDVWAGTDGVIYVAEHGVDQITVMLPDQAAPTCPDAARTDDDGDGYADSDEAAHGTDPCGASSKPPDFDGDLVGDLSDNDDDNDTIPDTTDQLFLDAQNGAATAVPLAFEWNPGDASLGMVGNSGFTGTQIASGGPRTDAAGGNIRAGAAGGYLSLATFAGTAEGSANNQVNALQIGFDSGQDFHVRARLVEPFNSVAPAAGHLGGIFFGPDQDNFIRLALRGASGGNQVLQLGLEQGGAFAERASASLGTGAILNLDLHLVGDFDAKTVRAYYELNTGGTLIPLGAAVAVPSAWFNDNVGAAKNTSLAGLMVSHGAAAPTTFVYDFFRVDRNSDFELPAPTGLTAQAVTGRVNLSWNAVTGASGYRVYRSTTSPVALTSANRLNGGNDVFGTSYADSAVVNGTTYRYVVTAVGGASGESPASQEVAATPPLPAAFQEQNGQVVFEAERFDANISRGGKSWSASTANAGYAGTSAMFSGPNTGSQIDAGYQTTSPEMQYRVNFTQTGTYYVWLRVWAGSTNDNAAHAGLDGQAAASADRMTVNGLNNWVWTRSTMDGPVATLNIASAGQHTFNLWMREDGLWVDRVLLTQNSAFTPTGAGPAESPRTGGAAAFNDPFAAPGTWGETAGIWRFGAAARLDFFGPPVRLEGETFKRAEF